MELADEPLLSIQLLQMIPWSKTVPYTNLNNPSGICPMGDVD